MNERRDLVKSLFTFQLTVFRGSFFHDFVANSVRNFFSIDYGGNIVHVLVHFFHCRSFF